MQLIDNFSGPEKYIDRHNALYDEDKIPPDVDRSCVFPIVDANHQFHSGCQRIYNQLGTGSYKVIFYSY